MTLPITEHSTLRQLRWASWGGETAVATGRLTGMWCVPDCGQGYPATVELTRLERLENVGYYTRASVRAPDVRQDSAENLHDVQLGHPWLGEVRVTPLSLGRHGYEVRVAADGLAWPTRIRRRIPEVAAVDAHVRRPRRRTGRERVVTVRGSGRGFER
ncbi:hypothetical protein [Streptomyces sp. SP18CS02]|uniref:hypothetical protein n=1 Tax=Streptomyces sp. SP18CS02 TaxID=3002531 RepID=UPI002E7AA6C7|nr:hypothetical protein [Streptomyces sp. SP18CS02]MEE1754456.1 hypothetical protein [Streptomyces sp. SP18CS02]